MPESVKQPSPSLAKLSGIFLSLLALLALTIFAAHSPLGTAALPVALVIAATKAILVMLYFMNVRTSSSIIKIFVAAGFVWLSILFTLTFLEYLTR